MDSLFLRIYKHVLPTGHALRITIDKQLRQFFDGLTDVWEDVKLFFDGVWNDLRALETTKKDQWEEQLGLLNSGLTTQQRCERILAAKRAKGGQSPSYIQQTLQSYGFDVSIHEWWIPGTDPPVARDPLAVLDDGTSPVVNIMADGHDNAADGHDDAFDGHTTTKLGYPLVNIISVAVPGDMCDGNIEMVDGGLNAADGVTVVGFKRRQYIVSSDPDTFPFYLYIGGETFPEIASVPASRRDEFEALCLKICPTEQWLGILVEYA